MKERVGMRKALFVLGLLSVLAQPAVAQTSSYSGVPVTRPMSTGAAVPMQTMNVACPTGGASMIYSNPTGCAAPMAPAVQPVTIPKKRWWQRNRTGYAPVCPCPTGAAVPVCPTGGAAPMGTNLQPVMVPKKYFWESDHVELMPVVPQSTGGAAAIAKDGCPTQPCPCPVTIQPCPVTTQPTHQPVHAPVTTPVPTGGAAPTGNSVRGKW